MWVLLVFPEDLGGHVQSGPTSIWSISHLRRLDGVSDVQRGVGLFTNLTGVKAQMVHGWPRLYRVDKYLLYDGPLDDKCCCTKPHTPMRGVNSHEEFHSSASAGFGKRFWSLSTHASLVVEEHVPLRAGGTSSTSSSLSPSHLSSAPLFSLAGHSGSASSLYYAGSSGRLSRSMLSDFSGSGNASKLFDSHPSGDLSQPCRLAPCYFGSGTVVRRVVTMVLGVIRFRRLYATQSRKFAGEMVVGRMVVWIWMVLLSRPFQCDVGTRGLALCVFSPGRSLV